MSCPICGMEATRALRPCGHCLCENCLMRVSDCPMCRSLIESNFRIYIESNNNRNYDDKLINISTSQLEFLENCCPTNCHNYSVIGLVLSPLIKLNSLQSNFGDELPELITKLAIPTLKPTIEIRQLLEGFYPRKFVNEFVKIMRSRMQIYVNYGISALKVCPSDINSMENYINSISENNSLKEFLQKITYPYPSTGVFKNKSTILQEKELTDIDKFLQEQLNILQSNTSSEIKKFALKNLMICYSNLFQIQSINNSWVINPISTNNNLNSSKSNINILNMDNLTSSFSDIGNYWF